METIEVIRGNTRTITVTVKRSDGTVVDLTGKTLVFVTNSVPQLIKKTGVGGSGFVITDAANGVAVLQLSVSETRQATPNTFDYSIELWESGDTIQTTMTYGKFLMKSVVNVDA
jgi:hypothetical protein